MARLMIHHKVENFAKWKPAYDEHREFRKEAGCQGEQLMRSHDDPNDVFILFDWDNVENAKRFMVSDDLKNRMKDAGVVGQPDIEILDEVESRALNS